ncbi:hypothetical protein CI109_103501 [Kwoniella shandongensis]|uniref:Uncharacterized protein n=1 Tax=Kwoniella shandongensis TaxID=1734106 RepID=A0A5M6BYU2_9TREE|nr:uncharacterized protein CI109_004597 [Kwoniella shandongensis]KAA5527062.1 hypothetical protein CI109_004597 [Kwoniella shandongensis]
MGIFSRLLHTSATTTETKSKSKQPTPPTPDSGSTPFLTPFTTPATTAGPPSNARTNSSYFPRTQSHTPSVASSSIASRLSKKPWSKKDKGSVKGKGKVVEDDDQLGSGMGGKSYEEFGQSSSSLRRPPPSTPGGGSTYGTAPSTPIVDDTSHGKRTTMFFSGDPVPSSPLSQSFSFPSLNRPRSEDEGREEEDANVSGGRRRKVSSGEFKKEGGILGKLTFENPGLAIEIPPVTDGLERGVGGGEADIEGSHPHIDGHPHREEGNAIAMARPLVVEASTTSQQSQPTLNPESTQEEELVEVLESAEKKNKFWKGMGRARRHSRSTSDQVEVERSGSPTPRKAPPVTTAALELVASRKSTDIAQPRPQQLRRPSSSFFHNPFHRSVSRTSMAMDLEKSPIGDDGSFQLKGFRHVSGMMEVEGAGPLEGYLSHVKRESVVALGLDKPPSSVPGSPIDGDGASPPTSFGFRPPVRPLSRPPSVANSLASLDEYITSSSKVSVAAFRKGIRRPSEGPATMSDIGHGTPNANVDDDDYDNDDLPLAMLNKPVPVRRKSSQSLLNMRELGESTDRKANASPALSFTVQRNRRSGGSPGGSGFVVRSTTTTVRPKTEGDSGPSTGVQPTPITSPQSTRPSSPAFATAAINSEQQPVATSPIVPVPADNYFAQNAPASTEKANAPAKSELDNASPITTAVLPIERRTPSPAPRTSSERAPPPPVEPIVLPQAGDKTPGSLNLPLPPDQMPDTPPKPTAELLDQDPDAPLSPGGRNRLSILEEPLRIISGLWGPPTSQGEDGFDPAFVVDSMRVLGSDQEEEITSDATTAVGVKRLEPQRSHSTLFDMRTATPVPPPVPQKDVPLEVDVEQRSRPPLSERLAGIASSALSGSTLTSPVVPSMEESAPKHQYTSTDQGQDPVIKSAAASPVSATSPLVSSFARARIGSKNKEASSSESESEGTTESIQSRYRGNFGAGRGPSQAAEKGRRHPSGPRKPSTASNRNRITSLSSASSPSRAVAFKKSEPHSDSESEDDAPLAALKSKASRSSLSLNTVAMSPPTTSGGLLPSPTSTKTSKSTATARSLPRSESSTSARPPSSYSPVDGIHVRSRSRPAHSPVEQRRKPLVDLGSLTRPQREQVQRTTTIQQTPPRKSVKLPPTNGVESMRKKTASPDSYSSKSGTTTTGDSGLCLPVTPKDSTSTSRGLGAGPVGSAAKIGDGIQHAKAPIQIDQRQRRHSIAPSAPPTNWQNYGPNQMMGTQHNPTMDPEAMRNMMKQQWQMQFMAAAYRASEEEWERASSVSGPTSSSNRHQQQSFQGYHSPSPMPPSMYPMMPYGGFASPAPQVQQNMMFPPYGYYGYPLSPGPGHPQQHAMGMVAGGYNYGTNTQSVFGGDFGPPATTNFRHPIPMSFSNPNLLSSIAGTSSPSKGPRPTSSLYGGGGTTTKSEGGPPTWGRRQSSGDWGDLTTPKKGGSGVGEGGKKTQIVN